MKDPRIEEAENALSMVNNSELIAIAQANEFPGMPTVGASKGMPRSELIKLLVEFKPVDMADVEALLPVRQKIEAFVKRYWTRLKGQAPDPQCPECIHGKEDRGVFVRCSDVGVAMCYLKNKEHYR